MNKKEEVLEFWFEGITDQSTFNMKKNPFKKWFKKDVKFDEKIRSQFEVDYLKAKNGEYMDWMYSQEGRLALVILLDQFSRNMYRNLPQMYDTDEQALDLTLLSIKEKDDQKYQCIERTFLYMPLQHAEDLEMQDLSIECFEQLTKDAEKSSPENAQYFQYNYDYAKKHKEVVEQFSRFPHRNDILGRPTTNSEREYLNKPGSGF